MRILFWIFCGLGVWKALELARLAFALAVVCCLPKLDPRMRWAFVLMAPCLSGCAPAAREVLNFSPPQKLPEAAQSWGPVVTNTPICEGFQTPRR